MNVQKFKADEVKRLFRHCFRTKDKNGNYYERTNPDIDFSKTPQNYSYECHTFKEAEEKLKKYMQENAVRNKSTVVAASWVIQIPNNYDGDMKKFFDAYYKIMRNKYNYAIDCFVHMDETTPHAHFIFCPILEGKFNAKAILTRGELENMHIWMEKEIEKELGFHVDLIKDETRERKELLKEIGEDKSLFDYDERPEYLSMRELKKRTQTKILKEYEEQKEELENYKRSVQQYKEKNIDAIISESREMVPKSEVQGMLEQLMQMLEHDLGKEKAKKYRKFLEGFGYIFKTLKDGINKIIEKIKGE